MLFVGILIRVEPSDSAYANVLEVIGLHVHDYRCCLLVALQSLTPLFKICHVLNFVSDHSIASEVSKKYCLSREKSLTYFVS